MGAGSISPRTSGRYELWRVAPAGGEPERVTRESAISPDISPDSRWLCHLKEQPARGLWRRPLEGGAETMGTPELYRYNFALTAAGIYFVKARPGGAVADVLYLDLATNAISEASRWTGRRSSGCRSHPTARASCLLNWITRDRT